MTRPLTGFRVLDSTDTFGVYATKLLADLGADVVRLEPPQGDPMRSFPPFDRRDGVTSLYYAHFNLGKRAVALDPDTPDGRSCIEALLSSANVLVESGPPQSLLSTKLGVDRVQALRPDLARVSIAPFGMTGPYRDYRGGDLEVAALSGLLYLRADPSSAPARPGAEQTAHIASLLAVNAALLGLYRQQTSGEGSFVEVAADFTASLATLQTSNANYLTWKGDVPKRRSATYQVWPTADGWMTYSHSPRLFPQLLDLLKRHGLQDDLDAPEYQELEYRQAKAQHIQEVTRRLYLATKKQELFEEAQEIGLRWMPVNGVAEIANEPFLNAPALLPRGRLAGGRRPGAFPGRALSFPGDGPEPTLAAAGACPAQRGSPGPARPARPTARGGPRRRRPAEAEPWLPLKGIRVLDFSWLIAGPLGTRLLANYGAEVLKVESYNRVDGIRLTGPHFETEPPVNVNQDGSFNDVNLGKKSILLNLNVPAAREVALKLAAVSDIVAANFTGDRLDRWGLGFDDLRRVKPDIIFLSMPVFDGEGPRRRWGGVGSDVNAISGINAISGFADTPPAGLGLHYPDFSSNPFHAQAAILAALVNRQRFGQAQFIEVSQFESTASLLGPALLAYFQNGEEPARRGNRSDRYCPHNVYRCAGEDQWCAISAQSEDEWRALCGALGHPEWLADPRFVEPGSAPRQRRRARRADQRGGGGPRAARAGGAPATLGSGGRSPEQPGRPHGRPLVPRAILQRHGESRGLRVHLPRRAHASLRPQARGHAGADDGRTHGGRASVHPGPRRF